jgi:enterobactin synthetase component D / holo-[acyl-carrier protein] synthase
VIEKILPAAVACSEAFDDSPDAVLFPEEEAVISRAVEKRRREFRTVRLCARRALRELGLPPVAVLPGEHREPVWPPGVVGSMTHCTGYRAAAVAHSRDLVTVGIDAEPHEPLPMGVIEGIALDEELGRLVKLVAAKGAVCWDRVLFCAKETVYKAWFPLTHRWLGFQEANVTICPPGIVNLEGRRLVGMIDRLLQVSRGLGWCAARRRRTRGSATQQRSSATASGCTTGSR